MSLHGVDVVMNVEKYSGSIRGVFINGTEIPYVLKTEFYAEGADNIPTLRLTIVTRSVHTKEI